MNAPRVAILPVTPYRQNCAILWDESARVGLVVDPGGEADRIDEAIIRLDVRIERILLTHGHLDHAGGAAALARALGTRQGAKVPIEGPHLNDKFLLDGIVAQAHAAGLTGLENATPDRWLVEGDQARLGSHVFDILHCPGHTPGHIVFVERSARFAVVGDVLFRGAVGRTDFPYGDHAALIASIRAKLLPLGDDVRFLCGHGPGSTIGAERVGNPFLVMR